MDKLKVGRVLVRLTFSAVAWAQGLSTINGSVADPSGSVIPAAKITVIEVETTLPRKAVTNSEGNFVISSTRPVLLYWPTTALPLTSSSSWDPPRK